MSSARTVKRPIFQQSDSGGLRFQFPRETLKIFRRGIIHGWELTIHTNNGLGFNNASKSFGGQAPQAVFLEPSMRGMSQMLLCVDVAGIPYGQVFTEITLIESVCIRAFTTLGRIAIFA